MLIIYYRSSSAVVGFHITRPKSKHRETESTGEDCEERPPRETEKHFYLAKNIFSVGGKESRHPKRALR